MIERNFHFQIFIVFALFCGLISCEKEIPFNEEIGQSKIVINSDFSPIKPVEVTLSNSLSILDNSQFTFLQDGTVRLFANDEFIEELLFSFNGFYQGSTLPEANTNYRLEVEAPNFRPVVAESLIPLSPPDILDVDTSYFIDVDYGTEALRLSLLMDDIDPNDNYYGIEVQAEYFDEFNQTSYVDWIEFGSDDLLFEEGGNNFFGGGPLLFDDVIWNNGQYEMKINVFNINGSGFYYDKETGEYVEGGNAPTKLIFRMYSYSEDLYLYNKSIQRYYETDGDPFAQPTQVYTNVEGGMGVFGGFLVEEFEYNL